jgi:cystathionine beta-lyase/cystathionine gamma-synthase
MLGNILQPDECRLLGGRLSTVGLRMQRASERARQIAEHLIGNPAIATMVYPTLFDSPEQIRIYKAQCEQPGGIIALAMRGAKKAAFDFLRHLEDRT